MSLIVFSESPRHTHNDETSDAYTTIDSICPEAASVHDEHSKSDKIAECITRLKNELEKCVNEKSNIERAYRQKRLIADLSTEGELNADSAAFTQNEAKHLQTRSKDTFDLSDVISLDTATESGVRQTQKNHIEDANNEVTSKKSEDHNNSRSAGTGTGTDRGNGEIASESFEEVSTSG